MTETRTFKTQRGAKGALSRRWWSRWMRVADWLGARRPLDLVCGTVVIIASARVAGHLIFGH